MIRNFFNDCILFQSKDPFHTVLGTIFWLSIINGILIIVKYTCR